MKILLSLSLLLGFSVPAIAHNEANGGDGLIPGPLVNDGDAMQQSNPSSLREEDGIGVDSSVTHLVK